MVVVQFLSIGVSRIGDGNLCRVEAKNQGFNNALRVKDKELLFTIYSLSFTWLTLNLSSDRTI